MGALRLKLNGRQCRDLGNGIPDKRPYARRKGGVSPDLGETLTINTVMIQHLHGCRNFGVRRLLDQVPHMGHPFFLRQTKLIDTSQFSSFAK